MTERFRPDIIIISMNNKKLYFSWSFALEYFSGMNDYFTDRNI